jgi:hypothetical protein
VQQSQRDYGPAEVIRTPVFWVMYAMFVMVGAGGLMAIAQLAPIANDFKIAGIPVSILGLTLPALTFALTIDRVSTACAGHFLVGFPIISAARIRCSSPSSWKASAFTRCFISAATRCCS